VSEADAAGLPPLTYLTVDSVLAGVGVSQVLPYVTRLAGRGLRVTLHTCEAERPPAEVVDRLAGVGVDWHAHPWRQDGVAGGLWRVARGAATLRGRPLVHCRSDLPAASALAGRPERWVWDMRSFWVDQRVALGMLRVGSAQERIMRRVEQTAASGADAVVTLTAAAVDELARRWSAFDPARSAVVPTCVDLGRFTPAPLPTGEPVIVLLSGSFNRLYDLSASLRLVERLKAQVSTTLRFVRPVPSPQDRAVEAAGATVAAASFDRMPDEVRHAHVGLCILRTDHPAAIVGAAPTKVAELLACGRPVVVNSGLGDYGEMLPRHGAGVVLRGSGDDDLDDAAAQVLDLLADPATADRCRSVAERCFDLERGVDRLLALYRQAVA
jgi:glycosyltransferase involved in cell wall biosynthesis